MRVEKAVERISRGWEFSESKARKGCRIERALDMRCWFTPKRYQFRQWRRSTSSISQPDTQIDLAPRYDCTPSALLSHSILSPFCYTLSRQTRHNLPTFRRSQGGLQNMETAARIRAAGILLTHKMESAYDAGQMWSMNTHPWTEL